MTGIEILSAVEQDELLDFSCVASSDLSAREVKFNLELDSDGVVYKPTVGKEALPEYLRSDLDFDTEQCPVMMSRILAIVHQPRTETWTRDCV